MALTATAGAGKRSTRKICNSIEVRTTVNYLSLHHIQNYYSDANAGSSVATAAAAIVAELFKLQ